MERKQSTNCDKTQSEVLPKTESCVHSKLSNTKWWPCPPVKNDIFLRKTESGDKLLTEELHEKLLQDVNRRVVICELFADGNISSMSGGGVGKTMMSHWYANQYEDEFNHIIWIDCGSQSLFETFKKLARHLKIANWNKLKDVKEFSEECFEILKDCKCLWIYDNVESCQNENIVNAIPKLKENSYSLIISRNQNIFPTTIEYNNETYFPLSRFNAKEGVEFLKANLNQETICSDNQLEKLCEQLQNLPMAIKLVVAALNCQKVDLSTISEQLMLEELDAELDNYEKVINRTVKISLKLILGETNGQTAHDILMIFGYIPPNDIEKRFFAAVLNSREEINKAIDLLTEYSLVSKTPKKSEKTSDLLSIPKLVQQVIRYQNKINEKETLRKIFSCRRFLSHQPFPFHKYADKELQKQFPKIWVLHLKQLIREKNLKESLEFAESIHKEFNTNTSLYNYVVCLEKNGQLEESVKILEELFGKEEIEEKYTSNFYKEEDLIEMGRLNDFVETGVIKMNVDVTKDLVGGHLLVTYWKLGNREKAEGLLESRNKYVTVYSKESLQVIFEILDFLPNNYSLEGNNHKGIRLEFDGETKKMDFFDCFFDSSIHFPRELQELNLRHLKFTDETDQEIKNFDMSDLVPLKLKKMTLSSRCCLSLERLGSADHIDFSECSIILDSGCQLTPKELRFFWVSFIRDGNQVVQASANEFLNFSRISHLELTCYTNMNISIDLSRQEVVLGTLELKHVEVFNWKEAKWSVEKLYLMEVPFLEKTDMKITEMELVWGRLDLSCLPDTIERLPLAWNTELSCSHEISLPKLKYLTLNKMGDSCLTHFAKCNNLTHCILRQIKEFNVSLIPESINSVTISNPETMIVTGVRQVDSLIIEHCSIDFITKILSHLLPKNRLELTYCKVDSSMTLPTDLKELSVNKVTFFDKNEQKMTMFDLNLWIPIELNSLTVDCWMVTWCAMSLQKLCSMNMECLSLTRCGLIIDEKCRLTPKELQLNQVTFLKNGKTLDMITANEFVDLHIVKQLKLSCREDRKNISIDLSDFSFSTEDFHFVNVDVIAKKQ